ncbi:MAG: hypothetical protein GF364_21535 [Candidatus Lokiarchaeota archaeon]|nr:hypothetical protein [Candidatus Lokiarchaeota archaeon]
MSQAVELEENIDFNNEDSDSIAINKFKWSGHTPKGQKTIKTAQKYLLKIAKSTYIKSVIYMGGGSIGKPLRIYISKKVDNENHLNISIKFQNHTINFLAILNEDLNRDFIDEFIYHFQEYFNSIIRRKR